MINRDRMSFLQGEIEHKQAMIANTEKTLSRTPDDDTFINQLWRLEDEKEKLEKELSGLKEKESANKDNKSTSPKRSTSKKRSSHPTKSARTKPKKGRK